jgi:hypothetical protein
MRLSTALRIAGIVVVAKAVLIGLVYWRRSELLGRPVDVASAVGVAVLAAVLLGVAVVVAVRYARRR